VTRIFLAGLVAGALVLGAASLGEGAATVTGPAQIPISGTQLSYDRIDIGARGPSPGDVEIIRQSLFNRRVTTKPIGRAELVCTFTTRTSRVCRGTYFLPRGKLVVGGSIVFRSLYELAVLGGTGLFDNARGTMSATRTSRTPRREFLLFRLVG
jgi:hypothetical protein